MIFLFLITLSLFNFYKFDDIIIDVVNGGRCSEKNVACGWKFLII